MGRHIQRHGAVGGHRYTEEFFSGVKNKIVKTIRTVPPQQRLSAFENNHPRAELIEQIHYVHGGIPRHMFFFAIGTQMKRTCPAAQVAAIGDLEAGQQRQFSLQHFSLNIKPRKIKQPGR